MSKIGLFFPLLLLAACGGSGTPPETPKPADSEAGTTAKDAEPTAADKESGSDDKPEKADDKKADDKKADGKKTDDKADAKSTDGPKPSRSAQDILTAPDVVFMLSFN